MLEEFGRSVVGVDSGKSRAAALSNSISFQARSVALYTVALHYYYIASRFGQCRYRGHVACQAAPGCSMVPPVRQEGVSRRVHVGETAMSRSKISMSIIMSRAH